METIEVKTPEGAYPIFVGADLALHLPIEAGSETCAIITNPTVVPLHAARVVAALRAQGFAPRVIEIPDGEEYKTLDTVRTVYDQLLDTPLDRRSLLIALGGGVVGDLAGFVAATYLRGVPFTQIPTTLLAMVDSSVGGKVAVDHPRGKNLIGAFKQPRAVFADTRTLQTLPAGEWRAGLAEAIKHGIIADAGLFERLESGDAQAQVEHWLARAIRVKVKIVERDPFEQAERLTLNLGHTFGHAFERLSGYTLRHGEAVAIGLVCAARLAARQSLCDVTLTQRIENLLRMVGLPVRVPRTMPAEAILAAMQTDKKRVGARVRLVVPRALGDVIVIDDAPRADLIAVLEAMRE